MPRSALVWADFGEGQGRDRWLKCLRLMLSEEGGGKFTALTGSPTVVERVGEGLEVSRGSASASGLLESGGQGDWTHYWPSWYFDDGSSRSASGCAGLAAGWITADEFQTPAQKLADEGPEEQKNIPMAEGFAERALAEGSRNESHS